MSDSTLKTVVVIDPETRGYQPSAHNLTVANAVSLVQNFAAEGRKAKVLDQKRQHRSLDPWKCKPCTKAAESASELAEGEGPENDQSAAAS